MPGEGFSCALYSGYQNETPKGGQGPSVTGVWLGPWTLNLVESVSSLTIFWTPVTWPHYDTVLNCSTNPLCAPRNGAASTSR